MADEESYSNPLAEDGYGKQMTNADFKKMLSSGIATGGFSAASADGSGGGGDGAGKSSKRSSQPTESKRKEKKKYYASLKKMEQERDQEMQAKYRDRAAERRLQGTRVENDVTEPSTNSDYRAVAPLNAVVPTAAERRKQIIQESKYLGGDMEHTHLVKGLDYALLEKVRAEIVSKDRLEEETKIRSDVDALKQQAQSQPANKELPAAKAEPAARPAAAPLADDLPVRSSLARRVLEQALLLKHLRDAPVRRNDLFLPKRMAYIVELEDDDDDDFALSAEVPTTVIRSKADCPVQETVATLSNNDLVINKLTQILAYLRQGQAELRKMKKRDKQQPSSGGAAMTQSQQTEASQAESAGDTAGGARKRPDDAKAAVDDIFADVGPYVPAATRNKDRDDRSRRPAAPTDRDRDRDRDRRDKERDKERDRGRHGNDQKRADPKRDAPATDKKDQRRSYFERPADAAVTDKRSRWDDKPKDLSNEFAKDSGLASRLVAPNGALALTASVAGGAKKEDKLDALKKRIEKKMEIDSYAECYPGYAEMLDAGGDSDDEPDYSKMDAGLKKGPVGRWDFETSEEYSDYMSRKEALPKAAFQYGIKMADGRKTRRAVGQKDDKQALNREWQQIQSLLNKRKQTGTEGAAAAKMAKY